MLVGFKMQDLDPALALHRGEVKVLTTEAPSVEIGQVEELIRFIDAKYVDRVDRDLLVEKAINSLLSELDPHSSYISKDRLQEVNEQLDGSFEGIGIEFLIVDDTLVVVTPIPGGPSAMAGLLTGDKIVSVNDSFLNLQEDGTGQVIKKLKGEKGSSVRLGVRRSTVSETIEYVVVRDEIPLNSLEAAYMLAPEVGYVKLNRFSNTTFREFIDAMEDLVKTGGMKHLVLDLRQNPGGYLQEATKLLSQLFQERNKLLVYTEGENVRRNEYETTGKTFYNIEKIAILIDEGSASASEIVAGAIQDWDRGVIIGRPSFGKGLVQEQYNLKSGGALRLTVARYYTPSGRSIQVPYDSGFVFSNHPGQAKKETNRDSSESRRYFTSNGREVFGGGGILPDVEVPLNEELLDGKFSALLLRIPEFILRKLSTFEGLKNQWERKAFIDEYQVPENFYRDFVKNQKGDNGDWSERLTTAQTSFIQMALKARVAAVLFDKEAYFEVMDAVDNDIQTAINALQTPNPITYRFKD